ncbi:SLAM family member 5-like isoform X2 [Hyperolius riggenbachi]|uniref:SLAM family member 5-like isoform X2 n=1 Tax=Hyperolius riggenbachi TaxID=752182 RepID=UPI0035A37DF4
MYLQTGVSGAASCGQQRNVSGVEGGNIVLPVNHTRIIDISWMTNSSHHFATTFSDKPIDIRDEKNYKGRLNAISNGSLQITNLIIKDQGKYTADIQSDGGDKCTQIYFLAVYNKTLSSSTTVSSKTGNNYKAGSDDENHILNANNNTTIDTSQRSGSLIFILAWMLSIICVLVISTAIWLLKCRQTPSPSVTRNISSAYATEHETALFTIYSLATKSDISGTTLLERTTP